MALDGRTWPEIAYGLADGERAAGRLHVLLTWLDVNPDDIAPAGDDR
jgi:hypothetical protein